MQELKGTERAVRAAVDLYARWQEEQEFSPLDRVVSGFFRTRRDLNSGERRWIAEAIYGSVRLLRRQERLLDLLGLSDTPEHRIQVWWDEQREDESVTVRNALRHLPGPETPQEYLRITLSFSDAMAEELEKLLGPEAISAGTAFNRQAPTTLRVNTLRRKRAQVQSVLPTALPTRYSPWGLELPQRVNIYDQPGFKQGWYEVQEEASQLAALAADVRPGMTVVDVGAGSGGKTLALAAMMRNEGTLVALDRSESRLHELKERATRAGIKDILLCPIAVDADNHWQPTGKSLRSINKLFGTADCVLVDAPCTGSGVIRRNPDAKWRDRDPGAVTRQQQKILQQAALLTRPGGCLVYVTCAFERSQNEDVVDAFLTSQIGSQFQVESVGPALLSVCMRVAAAEPAGAQIWRPFLPEELTSGPFLRTWPHRHGLDAFFAARLQRGL